MFKYFHNIATLILLRIGNCLSIPNILPIHGQLNTKGISWFGITVA